MAHIKARLNSMWCQSSRQDLDHINAEAKLYRQWYEICPQIYLGRFQLSSCEPYKTPSRYQKNILASASFYWRSLQALRNAHSLQENLIPSLMTFLPVLPWLHNMLENHALANVRAFIIDINIWRPYTEKIAILLMSALLWVLVSVFKSPKSLNALANHSWDISRIARLDSREVL